MAAPVSDKADILLEVGTNEVEFLLFYLGKQPYGINVSKVCHISIYEPEQVRRLPTQRPEVVGIFDFRGQAISVIDLAESLGMASETENHRRLIIVAEFNQRITAFVVDAVDRIQRCTWEQFESITDSACDAASVIGTLRLPQEGLVIILDLETIMASIDPSMSVEYYQSSIKAETLDRAAVRLVYCEDSKIIQKVLIKTLEASGFRNFKTFFTGAEGLEYLKVTPSSEVDVIVSDIEMPKMDGLTLCKEVRNLHGYEYTPFIFFSSMIDQPMRRKCDSVGADDSYSKPEIHLIVDAIESLLLKRRAKA
jgi:two-component system chemotaxis response regulator CheV